MRDNDKRDDGKKPELHYAGNAQNEIAKILAEIVSENEEPNNFLIEKFYNEPSFSESLIWGSKPEDFEKKESVLLRYYGSDEYVEIPDGVEVIGSYAFNGNMSLKKAVIPPSVKHIMPYAFRYCFNLEEVVILGNSLLNIGALAFAECSKLKKINIPDSMIAIEDCAFNLCRSLKSIDLPDSLRRIGSAAFLGCRNLCITHFPQSTDTISDEAFAQTGGVFDIPDHITSIGKRAFFDTSDSVVFIPVSVKKIGKEAFDTVDMKVIYYEGSEEQWKAIEINERDGWMGEMKVKFNRTRGVIDEEDE